MAFGQLAVPARGGEASEYFVKVVVMFVFIAGVYEDVVEVDDNSFV